MLSKYIIVRGIMQLKAWCETDIGLHRKSNQDRFLVDQKYSVYALADGMGGHQGGDIAATIAIQAVKDLAIEYYNKVKGADHKKLMSNLFDLASKRVFEKSREQKELNKMGTTLVVALYRDEKLYIGHVGDSRAYLLSKTSCNKRGMWQITEDHSLANQQVQAGLLTDQDIADHPHKNILTRSIGFQDYVQCDIVLKKITPNDSILMCSDGLTNMVSDKEIYETYLEQPEDKLVPILIQKAKDAGGLDNITVLLVKAQEGGK